MKKKILIFTMILTIIMLPQLVNAKNVDKYAKDGKIVFNEFGEVKEKENKKSK